MVERISVKGNAANPRLLYLQIKFNAVTMKAYLIWVLMLMSVSVDAQQGSDSVEIVNLLVRDYKTLGNWDVDSHLKNCTDNYLLVEDGEITTLKEEAAYYRKNAQRVIERKDYFDIKYIRIHGDFAYAVYNLRSDFREKGIQKTMNWVESVIFRRVKRQWKIEVIHSTKLDKK
jgi:hypothetical protein